MTSSETKNCQNCKNQFTIEPDDFAFYKKINVPPPTFCPECRLIRRLARRNERTFHKRVCEKCGKNIISVFAKDSGIHVYCNPCWWVDDWDGTQYAMDYDSSRPFLDQLNDLFHKVPAMSLYGLYTTLVNSDYTNMVGYLKNCYMVTYSDHGENNAHNSFVNHTKESIDNLMGLKLELCYETINCTQCYKTFFSVDCNSCDNVYFSKNLSGCSDCFGCTNLRSKKYYIFNKPYAKEEYSQRLKELYPSSIEKITAAKKEAQLLWEKFPQKYMHGFSNVASSGDYLSNSKNAKDCFIGFDIEDSRFCSFITGKMTDTYDFTNYGENSSLIYDSIQAGNQVANIKMSHFAITNCQDVEYGIFNIGSKNILGCVGLKKREYCILNKQYTKEEYEQLRGQIIEQMNALPYKDSLGNMYRYGEFFPIQMSPFGYNETTAQEFFPLTKEQALQRGYHWRESEPRDYKIGGEVMECKNAGKVEGCATAFKLHPLEIQFYKQTNFPVPLLCPSCRHQERLKYRNPLRLWVRRCACAGAKSENGVYQNEASHSHGIEKCPNTFETSYALNRPEIVYCEQCYQQEVG